MTLNQQIEAPRGETLFTEVGVLLLLKAEELVDNTELNCWMKSRENERVRLLTQEADKFPSMLTSFPLDTRTELLDSRQTGGFR